MQLTSSQQLWLTNRICEGLRDLGLPITPQAVEHQLGRIDRTADALRAAGAADPRLNPPDPYAPAIAKMRESAGSTFAERYLAEWAEQLATDRTQPRTQRPKLTDAERTRLTPPNPYAERQEER